MERGEPRPRLAKVEEIAVRATEDDGTTGFHERPTV